MKSIIAFKPLFRSLAILLFVVGILFACTERIDIFTQESYPHLVIYGHITTDTTQHYVRINRSSGYFATTSPVGISNAKVYIEDGQNTFELKEELGNPGMYLTDANVYGEEGKTYTLHVSVDFEGSGIEEYTSSSYLPYSVRMDSIDLKMSEYFDDRLDIMFYGRLGDNKENYLSFQAYRNEYALSDSIINWGLADDEYVLEKDLKGISCFNLDLEEEQYYLTPGDVVSLQVNSITKEYYDFIWHAQLELYGSNPIFSGPPANIETNIQAVREGNSTPLAGFFTAYSFRRKGRVYTGNE